MTSEPTNADEPKMEARKWFERLNEAPFADDGIVDRAGVYLLSILFAGDLAHDVAGEQGFAPDECAVFESRARKNEVFVGDKIVANWLDESGGREAFLLDAMCLAGLAKRVADPA